MFRGRSDTGKHLDTLQRDSWQLELIVTGFALAGMVSGEPVFREFMDGIGISDNGRSFSRPILSMLVGLTVATYYIFLCNFFINVVVRCLWIAAVGLRSVNQNIRYHQLRLAPRFREFLQRRHGNFDEYVQALDNFSSLIFALTFLTVAFVAGIFSTLIVLFLLLAIPAVLLEDTEILPAVLIVLVVVFVPLMLLYLVDFLTLGYLKRFRKLSRFYYPVYRFFGWVTLARLYRPFYYNLVTNRRTRYVPLLLLVYLLGFLTVSSIRLTPIQYLQRSVNTYEEEVRNLYRRSDYADQDNHDPDDAILILPSEVIEGRTLKVRIPIRPRWDRYIASNCPDLKEVNPSDLSSAFLLSVMSNFREDNDQRYDSAYVACLASPIRLRLDSTYLPLDDLLFNPRGTDPVSYAEFIAFVDLDTLSTGIHYLTLQRQSQVRSDTVPEPEFGLLHTVPFYYAGRPREATSPAVDPASR